MPTRLKAHQIDGRRHIASLARSFGVNQQIGSGRPDQQPAPSSALPDRDRGCKPTPHRRRARRRPPDKPAARPDGRPHRPRRVAGPVAQWLEPAAHNGLVAGSSPAGPTSVYKSLGTSNFEGCWSPHQKCLASLGPSEGSTVRKLLFLLRSAYDFHAIVDSAVLS